MIKEIELRLVDAPAPSGEIAVKDLAALAIALQELTTRISREVINMPGPGRTKQFMEELSQLRLHAVEPGSTVLRFSKGPADKLDVDLPEQAVADDRFWEIVQAMGDDSRPDWATDLIAESVGKLVNAIQAAAPTVVLGSPSRRDVRIVSSAVHVETWTPVRVQPGGIMTATGRLEKVDLRSHEFRVRDDVDQTVDLKHVQSDTTAAQLVGQWVVARGEAVLHESGRLVVLDNASISRVDDPAAEHMDRSVTTLDEILASAPGPDIDGGIDLTDDEFQAFLEAARS
jgi:hypothetical protein